MSETKKRIMEIDKKVEEIKEDIDNGELEISSIIKKYKLPFNKIGLNPFNPISEEKQDEYLDLLIDLIKNSSGVEEVYQILKVNMAQFRG